METLTQGMNMTGWYVGRCKSCKRGVRAGSSLGTCAGCGSRVKLQHVVGWYAPEIKCGARCRNAVGPSCDCSCGGANHGCNH